MINEHIRYRLPKERLADVIADYARAGFLAAIKPYIPNIEEMRHYPPTPVQWERPA